MRWDLQQSGKESPRVATQMVDGLAHELVKMLKQTVSLPKGNTVHSKFTKNNKGICVTLKTMLEVFRKYMGTKGMVRLLLILFLIIINIGCDQVSKKIVRKNIAPYETISVLNDHVTVTRAENPGAFLSIGDSLPAAAKSILLSILPMAILGFVLYYIISKKSLSKPTVVALCFIVGGGIGNVFDRIMYGSVTDFLHVKFGVFQTGIFNLADLSIVTGTMILLLHYFLKKKQPVSE